MRNPLLEQHDLPPFSKIEVKHVEPAIRQLIERNQQSIDTLLAGTSSFSWDNFLQGVVPGTTFKWGNEQ